MLPGEAMDLGDSATQDGPAPVTGTFALDLSREGITLYWLSSHAVWNAVEHVVLHDGKVAERMGHLRARMGGQPEPARVDVWLPEEQLVVRVLDAGGAMPTEATVAALFADMPDRMEFDAEIRRGGGAYSIAAIPRAVLEQTRDFLQPYGFVVDNYTMRDAPVGMSRAPVFPLDQRIPAAATGRKLPSRGAFVAASAGLLVAGGLLAGVLSGAFSDPAPEVSTVALAPPADPAAESTGPSGAPGRTADAGGRVAGAENIALADTPLTFAEPVNPLAVGRAQIDLPLPVAPAPTEAVGQLPQSGAAPRRGAQSRLVAVAGDMPRAPAIFARTVQTEIAAPAPLELAERPEPPAARRWTRHVTALTSDALAPAARAGRAPDLSALRDVVQPVVLARDPAQGQPAAVSGPPSMPLDRLGSYVAMLFGELDPPDGAPTAADVSGVRSRPAGVVPPAMVALSAPDPGGDSAAVAPPPLPAVARGPAAAAPVPAERSAPPAEFALSLPLRRPAVTDPGGSPVVPTDEPAPADAVPSSLQTPPTLIDMAALGAPSGSLPAADLSGVRAPARVRVALDWMPVQHAPGTPLAPPPQPAAESALNAMLFDILGAVPAEMAQPLVGGTASQPRALVAGDSARPAGGEPMRVASVTAAPPHGTVALRPPATAVQPLDLDPPRAVDSDDELASLLSPSTGVQVGRAVGPRQARPETDTVPQIRVAGDRPGIVEPVTAPAEAAAAPEPIELAALASDLPRARVVPRGTVPALPDIEFTALDRTLGRADGRPDGARGPAMAAPSEAPRTVAVQLPAPPPAEDGTGIEVAVVNASPDIVPPLRPRPEVIEARPDVVPPLRGTPEVIEAQPDIVPPLRDEALEEGTEVAALTDPELAPDVADDGTDLAMPRQLRPRLRPPEIEAAETERLAALAPSELALNRTDAPRARPSDLARVAPEPAPAAPAATAAAAPAVSAPEPKREMPQLPTSASVARAATIKNALPFGRMALIGVFGSSRNRHAIVRLRSGNFVKVGNGESIEGYQITGMSDNAIRLRRGGRETLLVIPR